MDGIADDDEGWVIEMEKVGKLLKCMVNIRHYKNTQCLPLFCLNNDEILFSVLEILIFSGE